MSGCVCECAYVRVCSMQRDACWQCIVGGGVGVRMFMLFCGGGFFPAHAVRMHSDAVCFGFRAHRESEIVKESRQQMMHLTCYVAHVSTHTNTERQT